MKKTVKSANLHAVNDLRYEDTPMKACCQDEVVLEVKAVAYAEVIFPEYTAKVHIIFPQ